MKTIKILVIVTTISTLLGCSKVAEHDAKLIKACESEIALKHSDVFVISKNAVDAVFAESAGQTSVYLYTGRLNASSVVEKGTAVCTFDNDTNFCTSVKYVSGTPEQAATK
ncbi:MAG: hypothetical protein QFB87_05305 [Patescibacteria group bacterium]|nr:hypothetical protein [Patescibacteria group bacterium]